MIRRLIRAAGLLVLLILISCETGPETGGESFGPAGAGSETAGIAGSPGNADPGENPAEESSSGGDSDAQTTSAVSADEIHGPEDSSAASEDDSEKADVPPAEGAPDTAEVVPDTVTESSGVETVRNKPADSARKDGKPIDSPGITENDRIPESAEGDETGPEDVSGNSTDTAAPDTAAPDTAAPDTAAPDTAAPDTAAPDTAAPDTAGPDTAGEFPAGSESDGDGPMDTADLPLNPLLSEDVPYTADADGPESRVTELDPADDLIGSADSAGTSSSEDEGSSLMVNPDDSGAEGEISRTPDPVSGTEEPRTAALEQATAPFQAVEASPMVLPAESAAAPERRLGSPGEFSIILEGQGWVFRSDLSTPGSWRFLSRTLEGEATRFSFLFGEAGTWNLVFERQDLSSGGSERTQRRVVVGENSEPTVENGPLSRENGASIPGNIPGTPEERMAASREALDAGRMDEALSLLGRDAARDDLIGRDARAAIVEQAAADGSLVPLITWLPRYLEDGGEAPVMAAALEVLDSQAGYDRLVMDLLEELSDSDTDNPEWLYRLGRSLEAPGENRDLDRAAALYRRIVDSWPLSSWREMADERLAWLERHYFRVR